MKYMEKIEKRKSIREFKKRDLEPQKIQAILDGYEKLHRLIPSIKTELVIRTGDVKTRLEGVAGYKGKSFMAPAYLVLLSEAADYYLENAGYMAEDLCLLLTELGISHCWLTADDNDATKKAAEIESDMEAVVVIACGIGVKERTKKRLDIFTPSNVQYIKREGHVAPKIAQEELVYLDRWNQPVDWDDPQIDRLLDQSFYAASLAPSFLNRQPYRYIFKTKNRQIILCVKKEEMTSLKDTRLDIGATMFNFDAIASEVDWVDWTMGEPEGIEDCCLPDEYDAVAYYNWE